MRWRVGTVRLQEATVSRCVVVECKVVKGLRHCHEAAGSRGNRLRLTRGQTGIRNARPQPEQPQEQHAGCP